MKKMMPRLLLICLSFCLTASLKAQVKDYPQYVVFTFERSQAKSEKEYYYWISPVDSLDQKNRFRLYPLYINEFGELHTKECLEKRPIDIFRGGKDPSEQFETEIKDLYDILNKRRLLLQSISIKWEDKSRKKENIKVYATPIKGFFTQCVQIHQYYNTGKAEINGLAYLPVKHFNYIDSFWSTTNGKVVKYADYSLIDFTNFTPASYHNDRARVRPFIISNEYTE